MTRKTQEQVLDNALLYIKLCLVLGVLGLIGVLVFWLLLPSTAGVHISGIITFFAFLEAFMMYAAYSFLRNPR